MDCNGSAEKKTTYMTTITLDMKSSRESLAKGCGLRSTENGTAPKDKENTEGDACKGQLEMIFRPQTLYHSSSIFLNGLGRTYI